MMKEVGMILRDKTGDTELLLDGGDLWITVGASTIGFDVKDVVKLTNAMLSLVKNK